MYCVVQEEHVETFLANRIQHIETYKKTLFVDDIYIIAPQLIAVYEDMISIDLFTVTPATIVNKDAIKVLFDPNGMLLPYQERTTLALESHELQDAVDDTVWYLFQYYRSAKRGNHIWCVHLLQHVFINFSKVLLHKYSPERAQLGLKTVDKTLPSNLVQEIEDIFNTISITTHTIALEKLVKFINRETEWIFQAVDDRHTIEPFWERLRVELSTLN